MHGFTSPAECPTCAALEELIEDYRARAELENESTTETNGEPSP